MILCFTLLVGMAHAQVEVTDAERAEVMIAVDDYLRARESGDLEKAHGMFGAAMRDQLDLDKYRQTEGQRRAQTGPLARFTPLRAMRHDEVPPQFVLDYMAFYDADVAECGYLVWTSSPGGLTLTRLVSGVLEADLVGTQDGADLMRELGCIAIPEVQQ
ncbi:hypothetical protein [Actibacterium sp. 188UL27-1]|uniref:hypothetical protein n=1 Tax=Actibacterium sp. 188UL27-1 TaxID=2786961 RepID=UPI001958145C|nr:hypothetical protein [Actibacterium sp. 188UL27-1]MBM7066933.1 hypothetical protein [Actibacterium sp. 188UL27-1]